MWSPPDPELAERRERIVLQGDVPSPIDRWLARSPTAAAKPPAPLPRRADMAVDTGVAELMLLDWRRRTFALYADVRAREPEQAWRRWRSERDRMFATHPQTPLGEDDRARFGGLSYYDYDPTARVVARVHETEPRALELDTSTGEPLRFRRFAEAVFELQGTECALALYWLEGYGGGVFLPFADRTNGEGTYGGGRYLLDSTKGADLGPDGDGIVLDFNFAYNPSCAYAPWWTCPLPPSANQLTQAVAAGERAPADW